MNWLPKFPKREKVGRTASRRKRQTHSGKPLKNDEKIIGKRLNVLFAIIFALFLILLGKLYYIQVLDKSFYAEKLNLSSLQAVATTESPRGQIFDATGAPLASTTEVPSITFTRTDNITASQMRSTALRLVPIVGQYVNPSNLTDRDKIDYYLADANNLKAIYSKIPKKDLYDKSGNALTASAIYALEVQAVPESDISGFSPNDLLAAEIFKQENATQFYLTSNIITGPFTAQEQAQIGVEESELPGISFGTAWNYTVDQNSFLSPLIGTVSTSQAGLPADKSSYYKSKGYAANDRVGTSYLEEGYESTLQGTPEKTKILADSAGNIKSSTVTQQGKNGDNLKLTVNSAFENGVQQILENEMADMSAAGFASYSRGLYAVTMNPETGAIYSINGLYRDPSTGQMSPDALGAITKSFDPGSTVKLGTLSAGWEHNVISGNQVLDDQSIDVAGSASITSWFTNGMIPINAVQALTLSSNTYAIQVALRLNGTPYTPNMSLSGNTKGTLTAMRDTYAQYGLGVSTGIDIPGEATGLLPSVNSSQVSPSSLMFEAFGQFDNYTPLQMAQYAATVANGGKRVAPHIVQGIYNGNNGSTLGALQETIATKVLNQVNISASDFSILYQGMYGCVNGNTENENGTGYGMRGAAVTIYAKDGEAQDFPNGHQTTTNNVVAFAPNPQNPQIAIAVMAPDVDFQEGGGPWGSGVYPVNQYITKDIVNLYSQIYGFK